ncbi:MAG: hypothetical protein ACK53Y_00495, partial [bacterium]
VTDVETKAIVNHNRDPEHKDQANTNNKFHAIVLALFYRKNKDKRFSQNMRVSILQMFLYLLLIHQK